MPTCRACGQENPEIARFCLACGVALEATPAPAADEERRVVTAVFTDLVGSTSRGEQLDPEDVRAMLAPYYARLRRELEAHGGTVEKFIGDAVVAIFGAPVSHEDDPERAVRAAVAIGDAIGELNEQDPWLDLRIRTAVNTGEALVLLDARVREGEGMAAGDVMNTAARLQGAAPINGIVVGEQTYRATRRVASYRELEPVPAKGKSEPVRVWELLEVSARTTPTPAGALVGRAVELDLLTSIWTEAQRTARRHLATIVGAPGIGKSRLVTEFCSVAAATGEVHSGRCLPYGEGITYWPVAEIVKGAAGILQSDDAATGARKLGTLLDGLPTTHQDELRTIAAALANLLGVETTPRGTYFASSISQAELHWGVRRVLELLAEQRPLLIVIEDVHWAEPTLLDLIRFIADGSAPAPLVVLASARPELLESGHGLVTPDATKHRLELDALSGSDSRALLAELAGERALPAQLLETVLNNASGNPLFIEEMVRMLVDEELLGGEASVSELESLPVPATLHALISSRLDRLPAQAKRVVQHAAVGGTVFWSGAVEDLLGGDDDVGDTLVELTRRDMIHAHEPSSVAGESEYAFKHVLIRDVAYSRLPKGRRVELHARFGEWVTALPGPEEELIEIVAYHLEQSCRLAREIARSPIDPPIVPAADALRRAAEKALGRESLREADRYYARALELVDGAYPATSLELRVGRGRSLAGIGEVRRAYVELLDVAEQAIGLSRPDLRCRALVTLGHLDHRQGRVGDARRHLAEAHAIAAQVGDSRIQIRAAFGFAALKGDFDSAPEKAAEELRSAISVAEDIDDRALRVEGHLRLAFLLFNMGDLVASERELLRCIELAGEYGSLRDEARATFLLGLATYYRGDLDDAERLNLQARDWLDRTCEAYFQMQNFRALGVYALARGDAETGERWLREAMPIALEEDGRYVLEVYRYLTEALASQGRIDDAAALADFAGRNVPEEDVAAQAYVILAAAAVAAEKEEWDLANGRYTQAIEWLEEQRLPLEAGEARITFAHALRRAGETEEARAQLELARDELERAAATRLAEVAERELEALESGAGDAGPAPTPYGVT